MKDVADIGNGIWVGAWEACDRLDFDLRIHLWSDLNRTEGHLCRRVREATGEGLAVKWVEGQSIKDLSVPVNEIAAYARQPGKLLVHCRSWSCRSTAIGLIAKIARGCDPFDAIADIGWGLYRDRHQYPGWFMNNVLEIVDWSACHP